MLLSGVRLFVTPWIIVHGLLQARIVDPVPFPSPGNLPNLGIKPRSPALQADSLPAEPQGNQGEESCNLCFSNTAPGNSFAWSGSRTIAKMVKSADHK